mmetsp:Transcript_15774/g.44234  ORF Transcript_15774/g.44234 Transcript_15774/m.44234 type:complete len:104 (-) Transcript_15774:524-835(-)
MVPVSVQRVKQQTKKETEIQRGDVVSERVRAQRVVLLLRHILHHTSRSSLRLALSTSSSSRPPQRHTTPHHNQGDHRSTERGQAESNEEDVLGASSLHPARST